MSRDADAFRDAILADPDNDAPRLVCADWYDENGDPPRAELIRLQCELAHLPDWHPRRKVLTRRSEALTDRHGPRWRAELPELPGIVWGDFERGFVASVRVRSLADLVPHAEAVREAAPVEAVVALESRSERAFDSLPAVPWLRRLEVLSGRTALDGVIASFADSPLLSTVRVLRLTAHNLQSAGLLRLFDSPHLGQLTDLNVGENFAGARAIEGLLAASWVGRLTSISLRGGGYSEMYAADATFPGEGLALLAASPALARLERLDLSNNGLEDVGLPRFLGSPHLRSLRSLDLSENWLTPAGVAAFREADPAWALVDLSLSVDGEFDGDEGDDVLVAVAESPCLAGLERLSAKGMGAGPAGAAALAASPVARTLRSLDLSSCALDGEILRALLVGDWRQLEELVLDHNPLGLDGCRALAESAVLGRLSVLELGHCELGSAGAEALTAAPDLGRLAVLDLAGNDIGPGPAAALLSNPSLGGLLALDFTGNVDGGVALAALGAGQYRRLSDLRVGGVRSPVSAEALAALVVAGLEVSRLDLSSAGLTAEGLVLLLRSPLASRLVRLGLHGNPIGPEGARALADCVALRNLRRLDISSCRLDGAAMEAILDSPHLAGLTHCQSWGNRFTPETWQRTRARFGTDVGF